jgi:hypothetical protein
MKIQFESIKFTIILLKAFCYFAVSFFPMKSAQAEELYWSDLQECWSTLLPTMLLFSDEVGLARLSKNDLDTIEYDIIENSNGSKVVRFGC